MLFELHIDEYFHWLKKINTKTLFYIIWAIINRISKLHELFVVIVRHSIVLNTISWINFDIWTWSIWCGGCSWVTVDGSFSYLDPRILFCYHNHSTAIWRKIVFLRIFQRQCSNVFKVIDIWHWTKPISFNPAGFN